jgi:hypothetical protein
MLHVGESQAIADDHVRLDATIVFKSSKPRRRSPAERSGNALLERLVITISGALSSPNNLSKSLRSMALMASLAGEPFSANGAPSPT